MNKRPDIKGNSALAKEKGTKGGKAKKGVKHKSTIMKEKIGETVMLESSEAVEKNIKEFLNHPDLKTRFEATKYFSDYFKPKKTKQEIEMNQNITIEFVNIKENINNISQDRT